MKPLHFREGFEGRLEALDGVEEAEPREVTGGDRGEKIQADVGGRGPVGNHRLRVFLKVVGRQRVVLGPDEALEEAPRAPSGETEETLLARRQRLVPRCSGWEADALGHER